MDITNEKIDNGKAFDWGRVSTEYAKYRDIYPNEFYDKIISLGLCTKGQKVLDVGTGTGVLPRHINVLAELLFQYLHQEPFVPLCISLS